VGAGNVSLKSVFICFAASPCVRLSRTRSTTSESDFAPWRLPFSGMIPIVRHTRPALCAGQDHSGSPRSLDASFSERAVLTDPAAVSGHLAVYGVPTSACQPLRCCRPAVKYLTRLNRFTFVTARASLCLRLVRFVTSRTQDSIPGEAAAPLIGAGISPAGNTRFILAHRNADTRCSAIR